MLKELWGWVKWCLGGLAGGCVLAAVSLLYYGVLGWNGYSATVVVNGTGAPLVYEYHRDGDAAWYAIRLEPGQGTVFAHVLDCRGRAAGLRVRPAGDRGEGRALQAGRHARQAHDGLVAATRSA